ncbi:hypothetical protein RB614_40425 [Phytohabitans sp. ZYX-F-186]|uniref:Uncharacterized protein n=1 Tax=Phytohabitans maris TaxID=3071409 RepID=A0ABU0ZVF7_9ACTN|nr:hypothetical protein [Phytohabitans sp. ZYX-F-186]MDQ7910776.1 hypothetical protein [Phytohabitans sp. ZYX-F-186]
MTLQPQPDGGTPPARRPGDGDQHVEHEQLDLVDLLDEDPPSLKERFWAFHEANPLVYQVLVRLAREWVVRTGRRKIGIAALFERARWEIALQTTETPRWNNSYRAAYARLILKQEADLADLFDLRRSAADEWLSEVDDAA